MVFIYATDLHGNEKKYNDILSYALENEIKLIHLGADILPKGKDILSIQKFFVKGFLRDFYKRAQDRNIRLLTLFGNDDIITRKKYFKKYGSLLDENPVEIEGMIFKAYPYVCDYPFPLKTICKLDYIGWERPECSWATDVTENGFKDIENIDTYLASKTTIQDDLKNEKVLSNNVIMTMHMPPSNLDLDVCGTYFAPINEFIKLKFVGSKSIYNWIEQEKPLLTLHGHIHESYNITGVWKRKIGETLVVQPGQMSKTRFVVFKVKPGKVVSSKLVEV
jgi:uncharacterized protein